MRYDKDAAADDSLDAFPNGPLALHFANTKANHSGESAYDYLENYETLAAWCRRAGAISPAFYRGLLDEAKQAPRRAAKAFASALELRRALYDLGSAAAHGQEPPRKALDTLNVHLPFAYAHGSVRYRDGAYAREWRDDPSELSSVLWPIARSAADLLVSADASRIVECEGADCTWLFVDATKNRSKRFCRSAGCGNRARVRRFYQRHA